nr:hypothetical protein [Tanacetum cinerariifolium]
MESSATWEYPSLIHTFFVTHTVNRVFTRDEDRVIYAPKPRRVCPTMKKRSMPGLERASSGYESTPEFGSKSDGCEDDKMADDEDGGEDEEDEEDSDRLIVGTLIVVVPFTSNELDDTDQAELNNQGH